MKCVICKQGETHKDTATITLQRDKSVIIFKKVPAQICENCGEYYLSESISQYLLTQAGDAIRNGAEIEILHFIPPEKLKTKSSGNHHLIQTKEKHA